MTRKHFTLSGVLAVLGLLGAAFYTGTERLIELNERLGASSSRVDTLEARVYKLERRLKIRSGMPQPSEPEGVLRRVWHLIF